MSYNPTLAPAAKVFVTFDSSTSKAISVTSSATNINITSGQMTATAALAAPFVNGTAVTVDSSKDMPAGIVTGRRYFIGGVSGAKFSLYADSGLSDLVKPSGIGSGTINIRTLLAIQARQGVDFVYSTKVTNVFGVAFIAGLWADAGYAVVGGANFGAGGDDDIPLFGLNRNSPLPTTTQCFVNACYQPSPANNYYPTRCSLVFVGNAA